MYTTHFYRKIPLTQSESLWLCQPTCLVQIFSFLPEKSWRTRYIHPKLESIRERPAICPLTWPFVSLLLFPRFCIIQKSIDCVCLLCPAPNKPLFVPVTKANILCVANKFQGLLDMMTNCNAVYILQTIHWYEKTMAEREPIEMRESPGHPTGPEMGNKEAVDDASPSSDPRRGGVGAHDHTAGLQCCFCLPGGQNWHIRISSV